MTIKDDRKELIHKITNKLNTITAKDDSHWLEVASHLKHLEQDGRNLWLSWGGGDGFNGYEPVKASKAWNSVVPSLDGYHAILRGDCYSIINDKQSLQAAQHFLTLLDESAEKFTFQYFADCDKENNTDSGHFYDSIENSFDKLVALNDKGYGVFVVVNKTDGKGRKIDNIVGVRTVFQELDDGIIKENPIEPNFIVESSLGKYHNYFLCDGLSRLDYSGVMARMIKDYGSDKNAKDISRVLRLPGFFHMKRPKNKHLVTITHESGLQNYSKNEILSAFPIIEEKEKPKHKSTNLSIIVDDQSEQVCINRVIDLMQKTSEGSRHGGRLGAAKLAGGFIAGGFILEQKALDVLLQISDSISDSGVTSKTERKTIMDGLEYGKAEPIRDVFFKREYENKDIKKQNDNVVVVKTYKDTQTHSQKINILSAQFFIGP